MRDSRNPVRTRKIIDVSSWTVRVIANGVVGLGHRVALVENMGKNEFSTEYLAGLTVPSSRLLSDDKTNVYLLIGPL